MDQEHDKDIATFFKNCSHTPCQEVKCFFQFLCTQAVQFSDSPTNSIHGPHEDYKPASSSSHCTAMVFKHVRALGPWSAAPVVGPNSSKALAPELYRSRQDQRHPHPHRQAGKKGEEVGG